MKEGGNENSMLTSIGYLIEGESPLTAGQIWRRAPVCVCIFFAPLNRQPGLVLCGTVEWQGFQGTYLHSVTFHRYTRPNFAAHKWEKPQSLLSISHRREIWSTTSNTASLKKRNLLIGCDSWTKHCRSPLPVFHLLLKKKKKNDCRQQVAAWSCSRFPLV